MHALISSLTLLLLNLPYFHPPGQRVCSQNCNWLSSASSSARCGKAGNIGASQCWHCVAQRNSFARTQPCMRSSSRHFTFRFMRYVMEIKLLYLNSYLSIMDVGMYMGLILISYDLQLLFIFVALPCSVLFPFLKYKLIILSIAIHY